LKKIYFFLLLLNSLLAFAQFGPKVKFTPENKIKYEILSGQLDSDLNILRNRIREQKEKLKTQDGSYNYVNYQLIKDSLCNVYLNNVSKLVPEDQIKEFWKVVNRRMKKSK
jgi:hypothetical protein